MKELREGDGIYSVVEVRVGSTKRGQLCGEGRVWREMNGGELVRKMVGYDCLLFARFGSPKSLLLLTFEAFTLNQLS
ncbi:unnamed protein product [Sphenostylis stenocarpa]|uniref:Uncharacterized protein n=1 Tax=Sphenostylis stenocarpa TaxID=92480 RepID=A0AA86VRC5_9FABA|nr:unnamed protein product [Sphenostylis stenocarpa]